MFKKLYLELFRYIYGYVNIRHAQTEEINGIHYKLVCIFAFVFRVQQALRH